MRKNMYIIINILSYTYQLNAMRTTRYKAGKPFMDKNPRHTSFAPFLCSPLLIYGSQYYHMLYPL
jgi:hypothetical protein